MALIKCPECNREVSSDAKTCPHCGKDLSKSKKSALFLLIFFLLLGALGYCVEKFGW